MKLQKIRIENFQNIIDSNEFDVGDITCLVGKNESGKTSILKAIHRINSVSPGIGTPNFVDRIFFAYNPEKHYPKKFYSTYKKDDNFVTATFILDEEDKKVISSSEFGEKMLPDGDLILTITQGCDRRVNEIKVKKLDLSEERALQFLISLYKLPAITADIVLGFSTAKKVLEYFGRDDIDMSLPKQLIDILTNIRDNSLPVVVFDKYIRRRVPKFLYFDEYYQIKGQDNLDSLRDRKRNGKLQQSDYPMLALMDLAGLDWDDIFENYDTKLIREKLEIANTKISKNIFGYWYQNNHLSIEIEIRPAERTDLFGMTSGKNIFVRVMDSLHGVSIPLGTRSKGFLWLFSFLVCYDKIRRDNENLILLLDEPGLLLHGKAQADLLAYFEKEIKPHHQLIYTTHSPFMVDPAHFDRVRIVQNLSIEPNSENLPEDKQGTKVSAEMDRVESDGLFPLQGALGYELYQSLLISPNCLIVEGFSDRLYIETISDVLQQKKRPGLSVNWTIIHVGSASKVSTFIALIGANPRMNVAVLIDFQKKRHQSIKNLYERKLLAKKKVMTFADFTNKEESDIEDMFDPDLYLKLVNGEFNTSIKLEQLSHKHPRITQRVEKYFEKNPLLKKENFSRNHNRPAKYLRKNISSLEQDLSDKTLDRFQNAFDALNKLLQ